MRPAEIFNLGTHAETPAELRRKVVFANTVYLVVGGLLLFFNLVRFDRLLHPGQRVLETYVPLIIVFISAGCLWLNRKQQFLLAKVIFVMAWIGLVIVFPVVRIGPSPISYFMHPYFSILFSPIVHLLFSFKHERIFYLFFTIVFFILAAFSLDLLLIFDRSGATEIPLSGSLPVFRFNLIIFWLFLNLLIVYVLRINIRLYKELEIKNELIRAQNSKLDDQSMQLSQQNKVLEERVAERTLSLTEQNRRLKEYAFMHAHILRAPCVEMW